MSELGQRDPAGLLVDTRDEVGEHSHVHAVVIFYAWTAVASAGMLLFLIPGRGLPMGGDLEYADEVTLARALENRQDV